MNKYLEKIAAKLDPAYKQEIYKGIGAAEQQAADYAKTINPKKVKDAYKNMDFRKTHLATSGDNMHRIGRELLGHKYGRTYATKPNSMMDDVTRIGVKRQIKDQLGQVPVSMKKDVSRAWAILGRVVKARGR